MEIFIVGDLFLNPCKRDKYINIGQPLVKIISSCDYLCLNLEGPIISSTDLKPSPKKGPVLCQDKERLEQLNLLIKDTKRIYTLANNHIMDYGIEGLKSTYNNMKKYDNVYLVGAGENFESIYKPLILRDNKNTIAIINMSEGGFGVSKTLGEPGYAYFNPIGLETCIRKLKKQCDRIVMIIHAGLEEQGLPLPEIRALYSRYIDFGADVVVAHHPHVIQGMEWYSKKPIYYSLGNFMFDSVSGKNEAEGHSIGILVTIEGEKINTEIIPLCYKDGTCDIDTTGLSREIFEESTKDINNKSVYENEVNTMCLTCYEEYYQDYYKDICGTQSLLGYLRGMIKKLVGRDSFDEDMLYHNLEINTHFWTVRRAVEIRRKVKAD